MVAIELEVLAKKFDRFGWERDRGSMAHDRMVTDWMAALQDFPLDEIRAACAEHVQEQPDRMPNEGHIRARVVAARGRFVAARKGAEPPPPERKPVTAAEANAILAAVGYAPKRMGDSNATD